MTSSQSLLGLFVVLLQRWKLLLAGPVVGAVLAGLAALVIGPRFSAESTFLPESGEASMSRLSGLAAQLGVNVGAPSSGESIDFYANLITSKGLLRDAVTTEYTVPEEEGPRTLVEIFDIEEETQAESTSKAVDRLAEAISITTLMDANLVELRVTARSPSLAVQVNQRVLELVKVFNLETRQSRAAAERTFIETRLEEAARDLRSAEAEMQRFLESNRGYQGSPELRFRSERLQRAISLRQQVYSSLAEGYEQARIEEVRNTPVLTVIQAPEVAVREVGFRLPGALIPGAVLGLIVAVVLAFWRDYWARQERENPADYERWRTTLRRVTGAVKRRGQAPSGGVQ